MHSALLKAVGESMICVFAYILNHQLTDTVWTESLLLRRIVYVLYVPSLHLSQRYAFQNGVC